MEMLDDRLLEHEDFGERPHNARSCSVCQMVTEIEKERENAYEARAMEEEEDVKENFSQGGEYAVGWLVETAVTGLETMKKEMHIPQLEMERLWFGGVHVER